MNWLAVQRETFGWIYKINGMKKDERIYSYSPLTLVTVSVF